MAAKKALIIFSGGQDSSTCIFWAKNRFQNIEAIHFSYGQKHAVESQQAQLIANKLDIPCKTFSFSLDDIVNPSALFKDSSLEMRASINEQPASTFIDGRNILMLSYSAIWAKRRGIHNLVTGVCQTDYSAYPDCREDFVRSMEESLRKGMGYRFRIHRPLMFLTKAETFELAHKEGALEFVLEHSHTCYRGDRSKRHAWGYGCDNCPACELRKKGYLNSSVS